MTEQASWFEDAPMPALLRHARATYGTAMRRALAEAGYDDIPGNGLYVIGALAPGETPLADVIGGLGMSKQAAGQLVDMLVLRGYLARAVDEADRRRLTVTLTERGQAAAAVQRATRMGIDTALAARMGAERISHARAALWALIEMGKEARG
jgi:DNA-binding MarR family transcriptional regulator